MCRCFAKANINDGNDTVVVTLFANHIEQMINMPMLEIMAMASSGLNLKQIFDDHLIDCGGIFQINMSKYKDDISFSIVKCARVDEESENNVEEFVDDEDSTDTNTLAKEVGDAKESNDTHTPTIQEDKEEVFVTYSLVIFGIPIYPLHLF